ncbi:type II toxin -antitoxin system TacA 1-like antitoxin [Hyphomicrobium sp.]|uniref:type II toxin -antitoxin system TacA 1-like antitoxin n=1 Tax=Hyphomicrobium sp. TaxID=82 RepID=UPI002FDF47C7
MAEPKDDDLELVYGGGNVFRDFGRADADLRQAMALMSDDTSPTVITLSPDDQKRLVEQFLSSPEPTDGLKRAAKAHAALIRRPQSSETGK